MEYVIFKRDATTQEELELANRIICDPQDIMKNDFALLKLFPNKVFDVNVTKYDSDTPLFLDFLEVSKAENIFCLTKDESLASELLNKNLNVSMMVTNLNEAYRYMAAGVKALFLHGDAGFLAAAAADMHIDKFPDKNVKIYAQGNFITELPIEDPQDLLKRFFIRPEDVYLYQDVLDGIILVPMTPQVGALKPIMDIYEVDQEWFGNLNEIIYTGGRAEYLPIHNQSLPSSFGYVRFSCKQKCFGASGCNICGALTRLAKTLYNKDIFVEK